MAVVLLAAPPPVPFALVAAAGRQPAVRVSALPAPCVRTATSTRCSFAWRGLGPPRQLTVVRPGETVRLVAARRPTVAGWDAHPVCARTSRPGPIGRFRGGRWTVRLPPGRYLVHISFGWRQGSRRFEETGVVGLWISRTEPRRIVAAPLC